MNKKKLYIIIGIIALIIVSQWSMVKLVYAHKINGSTATFLAGLYNLKAGVIQEEDQKINISLKDFFDNVDFANHLAQNSDYFADLTINQNEVRDLIWSKLLKQAWLSKIANDNDINITDEDINYYIEMLGGQAAIDEIVANQNITFEDYKYFLIEPDMLEAKVYNYLLLNFADQIGVAKIQEAYALLESEEGDNWNEVVEQYSEDSQFSETTFWLSEEELVDVYQAISEVEEGGFSKIVQVPGGYIIWHVISTTEEEGKMMKEVNGLFIYAQTIDDFFDEYLNSVEVKRIY